MRFKPGQLVLLTAGEYDDYTVRGLFRVVEAFDPDEVQRNFRQTWKASGTQMDVYHRDFATWLKAQPFVESLDEAMEWYFAAYDKPKLDAPERFGCINDILCTEGT